MTKAMHTASFTPSNQRIRDLVAIVGRIAISILFFASAYIKVVQPDMIVRKIEIAGLPFARIGLLLAIFLEVLAPILLILGFKTSVMAAVLLLYSLITAVLFHGDFLDQAQYTQFLKNLAIGGGLLQIIAFGPGKLSLDYIRIAKG